MRAFYFMKIDYIMTRKQMYILPLFYLLAMVISQNAGMGDMSLLVGCSYVLFISTVFSTTPFAYSVGKNKGFLLLFPATVADRVLGRFLFGLSFEALMGVLCGMIAGVNMLRGIRISLWSLGIILCSLAVGILLTALEFLFFYLFGEGKDNWQYLSNLVRVAPGMVLFFSASHISKALLEDTAASGMGMELAAMGGKLMQAGVIAVAASLLLTAAAVAVCVKVIEKRDYA